MSDERFVVGSNEIGEIIVTDVETGNVCRYGDISRFFGLIRLLNELSTSCRQLEREVKSLNAFLVHKGFAEEYIRWKGDA